MKDFFKGDLIIGQASINLGGVYQQEMARKFSLDPPTPLYVDLWGANGGMAGQVVLEFKKN